MDFSGKRKLVRQVLIGAALAALLGPAEAREPAPAARGMTASPGASSPTDYSAQARRRPPTRLRVYPLYRNGRGDPDIAPRYYPGPNAVRDCTAHYVQEYRPSGTVITPRMNCVWRPG